MTPVRLQLSRRAGFNLQALSHATNGLPAVNVARPGAWGNPWKVGPDGNAACCVETFRTWMEACLDMPEGKTRQSLDESLRGRNLACWCKPGEPCHADVLLEVANR